MATNFSPELETELSRVQPDEALFCTILFKDGDTELQHNVAIAMPKWGECHDADDAKDIDYHCDSMDAFRALLDPNSDEDFVVVAFCGGECEWDSHQHITYTANGWTLTLDGYMVGGRWEYTATSPEGNTFSAGNEWCFEDSDGNALEAPAIDDLTDVLIDAEEVLEGNFGDAVAELPDYDAWTHQ